MHFDSGKGALSDVPVGLSAIVFAFVLDSGTITENMVCPTHFVPRTSKFQ